MTNPTHTNPTPGVSCRYGAPMGRPNSHPGDAAMIEGRFHLVRVHLDSGGYDAGGAYWGTPSNLYFYEGPEDVHGYVRGNTREQAKKAVLEIAPGATFFR